MDVSFDQATLASGHQDGSVRLWEISSGKNIHQLPKLHSSHTTCVQFSPGSIFGGSGGSANYLLTASRDNSLILLDTRTYGPVLTCRAPGFRVACDWSRVSFSPDGSLIAAGSADGRVFIWSVSDGQIKSTLSGAHEAAVSSVNWGRCGLVSGDRQGKIVVWH